jgi:beta-xylosidase
VEAFGNDSANLLAWVARSINQVQCEVDFTPATFTVSVNVSSSSISVRYASVSSTNIEPSGHLVSNAIDSVNLLARMSNTHYVSVLGNTLSLNVLNMQQRYNASMTEEDTTTSAVANSFTAMIDDILVAYGASQIVISKDTGFPSCSWLCRRRTYRANRHTSMPHSPSMPSSFSL